MAEKIKLGVFGARRGSSYAKAAKLSGLAEVVAVCDRNEATYDGIRGHCAENVVFFKDFDEFIASGMDAVVLSNFFDQHAPFAIKAMEQGVHVFSETTAAVTLKECVDLCRAAEATACTYMLAENYPYYKGAMEMKQVFERGTLGEVLYADGEYVHPMETQDYRNYTPHSKHWRALMPSSYYLTHSLAPLMYMTDSMPLAVNAKAVFAKHNEWEYEDEVRKDSATLMLCEMDNGALFKITGWAKYGPHGNWYRLCCKNGGVEMGRPDDELIRVTYNHWSIPEGEKEETFYRADFGDKVKEAWHCGHGGGDYWVMREFLECLIEKKQPYFDVYRAATMAAVGILGWHSALNGGAEQKIPDFRSETDRATYENDTRSPFLDGEGKSSYPNTIEGR
ncbi:MAG: Gfo/Idh/MocA family oxidoreductase [Oscillospiraceae bacterium]|jgi:predicted dehydrogenase|nr:Gfo/Idh/MocA family oxidoreductase [Oscillospiraceae bacterium]